MSTQQPFRPPHPSPALSGNFTPTYDANGNVTNDSSHIYTWDADGNSVTLDGIGLTFDALDRMVEQARGASYTQIVYAPTGDKLALMNGQTLQKAFVPLPGGGAAVYAASSLSYYRHSDWLGSSRLASTPTRTVYSTTAYAPFGEPYAQSGAADLSFTGQNQDTTGGSYDFLFREYSTQGRWPSPDPAGLAAVSLSNPQSWNRYAYALNLPTGLVDPLGLDPRDRERRHLDMVDAVWICLAIGPGCDQSANCNVNGFVTSCGMAFQLMGMGMAAQCPNNVCSGFVNGAWEQYRCGGTACGYQTMEQMATQNNECGGQFCSAFGYLVWAVAQSPDAASSQLAVAAAKLVELYGSKGQSLSFDAAVALLTGNTSSDILEGGNINFAIDKSVFAIGNGCPLGRCDDGLHFRTENGQFYVHLDTANPFGSVGGFFAHTGVDVILGNIWYLIIPRH